MKASKLIPGVSIIIMVLTTSSCILNMICINGNGVPSGEERATGSFKGVNNATQANVVFETGDVLSLLIESDANLLPYFTTSVRNGILEIDIKGTSCIKTVSPTLIRITATSMESFTLSGSGDMIADLISGVDIKLTNTGFGNMIVDMIESTNCSVKLTGSGDITVLSSQMQEVSLTSSGSGDTNISGHADNGFFTSTGSGACFCSDLYLSDCNAIISGSGNIYASVSENLIATITGSGNLYYFGDPAVTQNRTGSGHIIQLSR